MNGPVALPVHGVAGHGSGGADEPLDRLGGGLQRLCTLVRLLKPLLFTSGAPSVSTSDTWPLRRLSGVLGCGAGGPLKAACCSM